MTCSKFVGVICENKYFQNYTFEILNQLWFVVHSYQSLGKHSFFLGVRGLDTEEKRHFPVTGPPRLQQAVKKDSKRFLERKNSTISV